MKTKEIAWYLGLKVRRLEQIFIRHRRRGFIWKGDTRAQNKGRVKFTPNQNQFIIRTSTLRRQAHMTLMERAEDLKRQNIFTTADRIRKLYLKHKITYRRTDVWSIYKLKQRAEIQRMQ